MLSGEDSLYSTIKKSSIELFDRVCAAVTPAIPPPKTRTLVRRHSVDCRLALMGEPSARSGMNRAHSVSRTKRNLAAIVEHSRSYSHTAKEQPDLIQAATRGALPTFLYLKARKAIRPARSCMHEAMCAHVQLARVIADGQRSERLSSYSPAAPRA